VLSVEVKVVQKLGAFAVVVFVVAAALTTTAQADPPRSGGDQEVTIGTKPFQLGATLSRPPGDGPFPAALLVHGSGVWDRNHAGIFKVLAEALTAQGIIVLRYDKRSHAYPEKRTASEWTLEEEVLEDAQAGLAYLRTVAAVDRDRVVVIGYSLGGMLAPTIAQRDGKVAGLVILAGPCRPIEQVMDDQLEAAAADLKGIYQLSYQTWQVYLHEKEILERFKKAKSMPEDLLWNRSPKFWREVDKNSPNERPEGLKRPVLLLHGDKDVHVGSKDMDAWRKLLQGRRDAVVHEYPKLDHSFQPGASDDVKHGTIATDVANDVANWVGALNR
jgi:pimeloyl-ACP methyl ester carboxylesterase